MAHQIDLDAYEAGVLAGDRTSLGRAITLVESKRADHQDLAQELLMLRLTAFRDLATETAAVPGCIKTVVKYYLWGSSL